MLTMEKHYAKGILAVMLCLFATSGVVTACEDGKAALPEMAPCACIHRNVNTWGCQDADDGEYCEWVLGGAPCGGDCNVVLGETCFPPKAKSLALIADRLEAGSAPARSAKVSACSDPEAFRKWLETAPDFQSRKSMQAGTL